MARQKLGDCTSPEDMELHLKVRDRLRDEIALQGHSTAWVCRQAGLNRRTVEALLQNDGTHSPTLRTVGRVAAALGIGVADALDD